jgi:hypothetical protein
MRRQLAEVCQEYSKGKKDVRHQHTGTMMRYGAIDRLKIYQGGENCQRLYLPE